MWKDQNQHVGGVVSGQKTRDSDVEKNETEREEEKLNEMSVLEAHCFVKKEGRHNSVRDQKRLNLRWRHQN